MCISHIFYELILLLMTPPLNVGIVLGSSLAHE